AGAGRAGVGNGNGAADDRHADDGAGAKAHGPDDAVSRRQDAGAWTAAVLLDCTDGIAFGAQWPVGPQDGSVRVPPYGALLLKRSGISWWWRRLWKTLPATPPRRHAAEPVLASFTDFSVRSGVEMEQALHAKATEAPLRFVGAVR